MADMYSRRKRSQIMSRIESRGNKTTELRLIKIMRRFDTRGWRRGSRLFGRPDFVFSASKLVVFVDGDFWHGHPRTRTAPSTNKRYWQAKVAGNQARDRLVTETLQSQGWKVLRLWESDLQDAEAVAAKISMLL